MSVFVGVEVRRLNSDALKLLNLGESLAANILFADFAAQQSLKEVDKRRTKRFAIGADQTRNALGRRDGQAIGENDMTAYTEGGVRVGDFDSIVEGRSCRHQRG